MVAEQIVQAWRRPGCGDDCALRMVIVPGLLGRQTVEIHDPEAHERHGRAEAGDLAAAQVLESGPLVFDRGQMRLWVQGVEVRLSPTEWRILLLLIDAGGRLVSHAEILGSVWGAAYVEDEHLLRSNFSRLRERLGVAAGLIETLYGVGYRFRFLTPGEPAPTRRTTYSTLLRPGDWSRTFACCVTCGTTQSRHRGHGLCDACTGRRKRAAKAGRS